MTALAVREGQELTQSSGWTPEALKEKVEGEGKLREIVITYFKSQMKEGHHYFTLPGQTSRKPALSKEGALNLTSLFTVTPEPDEPHETYHPDGHYSVRFRYRLRSLRTGAIVATGDGSCTTREEKYAFRWAWPSELPQDFDKDLLTSKNVKTKQGWRKKYKVPNNQLPDVFNTVLKMASKRALVDATLKLPLVSELFTQDIEEQIADHQTHTGPDEPQDDVGEDTPAPKAEGIAKLMNLAPQAGMTTAHLTKLGHDTHGVATLNDLTAEQAQELIVEVEGVITSRAAESQTEPAAKP